VTAEELLYRLGSLNATLVKPPMADRLDATWGLESWLNLRECSVDDPSPTCVSGVFAL
jgi:hypothetical protein